MAVKRVRCWYWYCCYCKDVEEVNVLCGCVQYQYCDSEVEDDVRHVRDIAETVLSLRTDIGLTKARPNCKLL